jgi:hypothetical protein
MKTRIDQDSLYPYFFLQEPPFLWGKDVEIDDDFYKEYQEIENKFFEMQNKLEVIYNDIKE